MKLILVKSPGSRTLNAIVVSVAMAGLASTACAQTVLLSDSFDRNGALVGSSNDNALGGSLVETWSGSTSGTPFTTSTGTLNGITGLASGGEPTGNHTVAEIAFTPVSGTTYTLSAVLSITSTNNANWINLGFDNGAALAGGPAPYAASGPWALLQPAAMGNPADVTSFSGPAGAVGTTTGSTTLGSVVDQTLSITLNTTDASNWTASWAVNGTTFNTVDLGAGSTEAANISAIEIGTFQVPGSVQSLELTTTSSVPEPSTWAMMVGGLGLLLGLQRLRRKLS